MSNDDFSNYPKSIGEHKAEKNKDAADWTPRDTLIAALRDMDAGKFNPTHLQIIGSIIYENGTTDLMHYRCVPSRFYGVGMLQAAIHAGLTQ